MKTRSRPRRVGISILAGLALAAGSIGVGITAAGAVDVTSISTQSVGTVTSVDVTPHPATSNTATVTVTLTGARLASVVLTSGTFAASLCGNHTTAGVALTPADLGNTLNCDGAGQAGFIVFHSHTLGATTFSYTLRSSGIGNNAAQCLPGGLVPCTIGIGDVATSGASFALGIPVFGGPAPVSTAVTPTTQAGRPGGPLNFTGVDFEVSVVTGTATLCNTDGVTNCEALTGVAISTTASGALTGSGIIPAAATTGARRLVVTTGARSASAAFVVLGTASLTLSASSGGAGSSVSVSGSNFDPGTLLFLVPLSGAFTPLAGPAMVTTNATGSFSGVSVTVVTGTAYIGAGDNPTTANNSAVAPFSVSSNSCTAATAATPTGSCAIQQTVQQQVSGGNLSMSQQSALISMSAITLDGSNQTSTGALNQVTVIDARGTLGGWTLTGAVTSLTTGSGDANHTIPNTAISWAPTCAATGGAIPAEVASGTAGAIPSSAALCTAVAGGGGGTFTGNASVSVVVGSSKAAGLYSGTLTLTLAGS